jgi:hypothetical protein
MSSIQNQVLLETTATRDRAEVLLRSLLDFKSQSERNLSELRQPDAFKNVTGRSSLDNAIASTQRMIEALNRVIAQSKKELEQPGPAAPADGATAAR